MRKTLLLGIAVWMLATGSASAQSLTLFFATAPLGPLSQGPFVLNLTAQSSSKVAQADVNAFDDFFLINGTGKLRVNFNHALQNKGQTVLQGWIGVAQFSNHAINYDIQAGFQQVKAKYNIPNARAGHVTIYRTINTGTLVYDYAVQVTKTMCQEYLFTPATGAFQLGFRVSCLQTLRNVRGMAGRPGRT